MRYDEKILNFIKNNNVLTLCTQSDSAGIHCCSCFYVLVGYDLIFASSDATLHVQHFLQDKNISGTINTNITTIPKIIGIQYKGIVDEANEEQKKMYQKKYPVAKIMDTKYWKIELTNIKYTDNTLGFGKKTVWNK